MGRLFLTRLDPPRVYSCATCGAHLAKHDDIRSKVPFSHAAQRATLPGRRCRRVRPSVAIQPLVCHLCVGCAQEFHGRNGRAYLFDRAANVRAGVTEQRLLMTGWHRVADVACVGCGTAVGWTYFGASDARERYKIGRFVLEKVFLVRGDAWLPPQRSERVSSRSSPPDSSQRASLAPNPIATFSAPPLHPAEAETLGSKRPRAAEAEDDAAAAEDAWALAGEEEPGRSGAGSMGDSDGVTGVESMFLDEGETVEAFAALLP
jgi:hypothetical protein